MVPSSMFYVISLLFLSSTLANDQHSVSVEVYDKNDTNPRLEVPLNQSNVEEPSELEVKNISEVNSYEVVIDDEKPRDKRALGVILQGLVEALGYTSSPISLSSLPNPNTTTAATGPPRVFMYPGLAMSPAPAPVPLAGPPRQAPQAPPPRPPPSPPGMMPPPAAPAAPGAPMPPRRRETLRFTGVVNFGNNSDLLGHLQQYERIFHATSTAAPPRPPAPAGPPRPPVSGKPALLPPFFVQIPLPIAPNLPPPLPPSAPRQVQQMEYTYTKQENKESYERESEEISDEKDVRKEPPRNQDTYIDEPEWKKKQRLQQEEDNKKHREENHSESGSSEENQKIEEENKIREQEIREREKENYAQSKEKSREEVENYEEKGNDSSDDDKQNNYKEAEDSSDDDKENNSKEAEDSSNDEKQNNSKEAEDSSDDDKKNNYKEDEDERGDSRQKSEEKESSSEDVSRKPEEVRDDNGDHENTSSESESDDENTDRDDKRNGANQIPPASLNSNANNEDFSKFRGGYGKFEEPFDFSPRKIQPPLTEFGNRLPIKVFEEPIFRGGLRNSYGQSLEHEGRIDESVADYFQKYKDPETGLFDSRRVQTLDGLKKNDPWWQNQAGSLPGLERDPIERIRQEYGPPAGVRYEEYNLEDDEAPAKSKNHNDEPVRKEYGEKNSETTRQPDNYEPSRQQYTSSANPRLIEEEEEEEEVEETQRQQRSKNEEPVTPEYNPSKSARNERRQPQEEAEQVEPEQEPPITIKEEPIIRQKYDHPVSEKYEKYNPEASEVPELLKTNTKQPIRQEYEHSTSPRYEIYNREEHTPKSLRIITQEEPIREEYNHPTSARYEKYNLEASEVPELLRTNTKQPIRQQYENPTSVRYEKYNVEESGPKLSRSKTEEPIRQEYDNPTSVRYENYNLQGKVPELSTSRTEEPVRLEYDHPTSARYENYKFEGEASELPARKTEEPIRLEYDHPKSARHENYKFEGKASELPTSRTEEPIRLEYDHPTSVRYENYNLENRVPELSTSRTKEPIREEYNRPTTARYGRSSGEEDEASVHQKRRKEKTDRHDDYVDDESVEPTEMSYTQIKVPNIERRSSEEDDEDNSKESFQEKSSSKIKVVDGDDSVEVSNDRSKSERVSLPGPLIFKGFDFIKYSPYFRPIQVEYEPDKLQRTADKILSDDSFKFGKLENNDNEQEDEENSKDKNELRRKITPLEKVDVKKFDNGEFFKYSPYFRPIQFVYEPKKLQRTADKILSYQNELRSKKIKDEERSEKNHNDDDNEQEDRSSERLRKDDEESGEVEYRSAENQQENNEAKPDIGLPERLTGKKLHEGESKELQAWPAPFDHTFDSTERTEAVSSENTENSSRIRDGYVEPTYQTPALLEFQNSRPTDYSEDSDVSPTYETPSTEEIRSPNPAGDRPLYSNVSPTYESPTNGDFQTPHPPEYSRNDGPRDDLDSNKNINYYDDLQQYNQEPQERVTTDEENAENLARAQLSRYKYQTETGTPEPREENPPIRLHIYTSEAPRGFTEGEQYRLEELRSPEVTANYKENNNERIEEISTDPPLETKKFEDPGSAHEFFELSKDDYNIEITKKNAKSGEQVVEATTIPSTNNEKELIGLLVVPQKDPNYQRDVPLTEFSDKPETDTEKVNVKEYRNKIATLKVSEKKQLSPNGPVHLIGFTRNF